MSATTSDEKPTFFDQARGASEVTLKPLMDSERSPPVSDPEDEPALATRSATSRRLSVNDTRPPETGENPGLEDHSVPYGSFFDADDIVVAIIDDAVSTSVTHSLETFYNVRLFGYVAESVARIAFEAMAPVFAMREFALLQRDPLQDVVFPTASQLIESKPSRSDIDRFSRSEIPVRNWRRASEVYYGSPTHSRYSSPSHTPRSMGKGDRHDSPVASRPSSLCSFNQRKKKAHTGGHVGTGHSSASPGSTDTARAPGVVFSTAPPEDSPRSSPRKAMAFVRTAHRLSTPSSKMESAVPPGNTDADGAGNSTVAKDNDACSTDERDSDGGEGDNSSRRRRRFSIDIMNPQASEGLLADDDDNVSAPVEVEYSIKRQSPGRRSTSTILPELVTHPTTESSCTALGGVECADETQYVVDSMSQGFQAMMLSPGVKLQAGETTKLGPDLPLFATQMRKSTFYQVDVLSLSAASSTQSLNMAKQLPDTPWRLQMTLDRIECEDEGREAQSDGLTYVAVQSAGADKQPSYRKADAMRLSVSKKSSTGTLFFKRQSKVIRPCILTGGRGCQNHNHCDGLLTSIPGSRWADPTEFEGTISSEYERSALAPQQSAFRDLAKQRAFQRKISTVVFPTRKSSANPSSTTSHRPTTAAISSPLARRRLVSKASRDSSEPLDRII